MKLKKLDKWTRQRTHSTATAARILVMDPRTVRDAVEAGYLKARKFKGPGHKGFQYRFSEPELERYRKRGKRRLIGKRRVVRKTRTTKEFVPNPISDFETPLMDALRDNRIAGEKVGSVPKPTIKSSKEFDWSKAKTGVFKMTMTQTKRAIVRFKCAKCNKPFIGLMEHRDPVPLHCSTCDPPTGTKWKTTSEWLAYPAAGIALAK